MSFPKKGKFFPGQEKGNGSNGGQPPDGRCFAEEIAAALGFILDAPGLTGQLICIDGGQHLGWQTPDVLGVE